MQPHKAQRFPWRLFWYELGGTAVLVLVGLSLVIVMCGTGSPMSQLIPSEGLRRLITGFLFGTAGATIEAKAKKLTVTVKSSGWRKLNSIKQCAGSRFRKSPRGKSPKRLQLGAGWRARAALLA